MPRVRSSISDKHCYKLLDALHKLATEVASVAAKHFVTIPVYSATTKALGKRADAQVGTFFLKDVVYTDSVFYNSKLKGVDLLVTLSHEFGHIIDFMRASLYLRREMFEAEMANVQTTEQMRISFEVEKRAWIEGIVLLKRINVPAFIIVKAHHDRSDALSAHIDANTSRNQKAKKAEEQKKERKKAKKERDRKLKEKKDARDKRSRLSRRKR